MPTIWQLKTDLRSIWRDFSRGYAADKGRERGFIGKVPALLTLRWIILCAVWVRFYSPHLHGWTLVVLWLMLVLGVADIPIAYSKKLKRNEPLQMTVIFLDIVFITLLYGSSGDIHSDFFLCYLLPILTATEHLGGWNALFVHTWWTVALGWIAWSGRGKEWHSFAEQAAFLWIFSCVALFLVQLTTVQNNVLTALREINAKTAKATAAEGRLNDLLENVLRLGFEFGALSMVDPYQRCIQMAVTRGVPPAWIRLFRCKLDDDDVTAQVLKTGQATTSKGRDGHGRRKHWRISLYWQFAWAHVPILLGSEPIGVLQAGWEISRRGDIDESLLERLKELAEEWKEKIATARPHVLLQNIAALTSENVGADAASIHLLEQGRVIVQAGAGWCSPALLAWAADESPWPEQEIRTKPWIDDADEIQRSYPELYREGLRSLARLPFALEGDFHGTLCLYFRQQRKITRPKVTALANIFADQVAFAMNNHLVVRTWSETANRARSQSRFNRVETALSKNARLPVTLRRVVQTLLINLDADNVALYQYLEEKQEFKSSPVMAGEFYRRDLLAVPPKQDGALRRFLDADDQFIENAHSGPAEEGPPFAGAEGIQSYAVLVLRAGTTNLGLIFVNYRRRYSFRPEDRRTMLSLAASAAAAIRVARTVESVQLLLERRQKLLNAIHDLDEMIGLRTPEETALETVLQRILNHCMELTRASAGWVLWYNHEVHMLEWKVPKTPKPVLQPLSYGISGKCAKERQVQFAENVNDPRWKAIYEQAREDTNCELAIPIQDGENLLGVLNLEHREAYGFTGEDVTIAKILASQAALAARSLEFLKSIEEQKKPLLALGKVATRVQDLDLDIETAMRLILTGVTAGEGLGFSRAMFFRRDTVDYRLKGLLAIGPVSATEAGQTWNRLQQSLSGKSDPDRLFWNLQEAERFSRAVKRNEEEDYPLSKKVQQAQIELPVLPSEAQMLQAGDGIFDQLAKYQLTPAQGPVACIPVQRAGNFHGLIFADREFQAEDRAIKTHQLTILALFAEVAAVAINNRQRNPSEREDPSVKNWQEIMAQIRHLAGSRLTTLDGNLDTLRIMLLAQQVSKETGELVATLKENVRTASETITRILRPGSKLTRFEPLDLVELLEKVKKEKAALLKSALDVRCLSPAAPPVRIDGSPHQIYDAICHILENAEEAFTKMADGHAPRIQITVGLESDGPLGEMAVVKIADNGPGVRSDIRARIFEKRVTTKQEPGHGYGLAFVKDIVEQHGGEVLLEDTPNEGACFLIRLPIIGQGVNNSGVATA